MIRKHAGDVAALIAMVIVAIAVGAYIVVNQDARPTIPFFEDTPLKLKAEFSDAQAVMPGQGQSVRVAGVQVGKIGKVELEDGIAVVSMDIEKKHEDLFRRDATALLRPRTGLKDMFIEADAGSKSQPAMKEGDRIPVQNTAPDIDPDEVLAALDTDTRAYLQLLVNGLGKGLKGNGKNLREVFRRFEPLHKDLAEVEGAFASRRKELARLIHNYGELTTELARNPEELSTLVSASNETFDAFASEDDNISRAVAKLPSALSRTESTLNKVNSLGRVLGPTLDSLRPAFRQLDVANREILPLAREGEPIVRTQIRPFVREARPYVDDLRPAAVDLAAATPDLTTAFGNLNRFFNMLAFNPAGSGEKNKANPKTGQETDVTRPTRDEGHLFWLAWLGQNGTSLFSTSDASGPLRRAVFSLSCTTVRELVGSLLAGGAAGSLPTEVLNTALSILSDADACPGEEK